MYQDGSKPELKMDPHRHFNMTLVPYSNRPGSLTKEWDHNFGGENIYVHVFEFSGFTSIYMFTQRQTITNFLIPWEFVSQRGSKLARKPGYGRCCKAGTWEPGYTARCRISVVVAQIHGMTGYTTTLPGVGFLLLHYKFMEWLDTRWQLVSKWLPSAICVL